MFSILSICPALTFTPRHALLPPKSLWLNSIMQHLAPMGLDTLGKAAVARVVPKNNSWKKEKKQFAHDEMPGKSVGARLVVAPH